MYCIVIPISDFFTCRRINVGCAYSKEDISYENQVDDRVYGCANRHFEHIWIETQLYRDLDSLIDRACNNKQVPLELFRRLRFNLGFWCACNDELILLPICFIIVLTITFGEVISVIVLLVELSQFLIFLSNPLVFGIITISSRHSPLTYVTRRGPIVLLIQCFLCFGQDQLSRHLEYVCKSFLTVSAASLIF